MVLALYQYIITGYCCQRYVYTVPTNTRRHSSIFVLRVQCMILHCLTDTITLLPQYVVYLSSFLPTTQDGGKDSYSSKDNRSWFRTGSVVRSALSKIGKDPDNLACRETWLA